MDSVGCVIATRVGVGQIANVDLITQRRNFNTSAPALKMKEYAGMTTCCAIKKIFI